MVRLFLACLLFVSQVAASITPAPSREPAPGMLIPLASVQAVGQTENGLSFVLLTDLRLVIAELFTLDPSGTALQAGGALTVASSAVAPVKYTTVYVDTGGRTQTVVTDCNGLEIRQCADRHRAAVEALEAAFPRRPGG